MVRKSPRQQIVLSDDDRARLKRIVNQPRSRQKHVWRARIILTLASGCGLVETLGMAASTVQTILKKNGLRPWGQDLQSLQRSPLRYQGPLWVWPLHEPA